VTPKHPIEPQHQLGPQLSDTPEPAQAPRSRDEQDDVRLLRRVRVLNGKALRTRLLLEPDLEGARTSVLLRGPGEGDGGILHPGAQSTREADGGASSCQPSGLPGEGAVLPGFRARVSDGDKPRGVS
jgi:hypothetical protein